MATRIRPSNVVTVLFTVAATLAVPTAQASPATSAHDAECGAARLEAGVVGYGCADERVGSGRRADPTCEISAPARYCIGDLACWTALPSPIPESAWPTPAPAPDAVWTYRFCAAPGQGYRPYFHWHLPRTEESWQAAGHLAAPDFTLRSNPPGLSVVNLATWFWADGVDDATIRGTSAVGLVVVGTPAHIELDPGDGSPTLRCAWSYTASDRCTHTYRHASTDGPVTDPKGRPAFRARARLVYTLQARRDGHAVDLPGLPDELRGAWSPAPIAVAEVQTVTTRGRG